MTGTTPRRMRLVSFKPLAKGALRGFAHLELPNGLRITDCPVLTSNGKAWATLPSKPVLEWRDRDLSTRFSAAVVELVQQQHPDALVVEVSP